MCRVSHGHFDEKEFEDHEVTVDIIIIIIIKKSAKSNGVQL